MKRLISKVLCGILLATPLAIVKAAERPVAWWQKVGVKPSCTSTHELVQDVYSNFIEHKGAREAVEAWSNAAIDVYGLENIWGAVSQASHLVSVYRNARSIIEGNDKYDQSPEGQRKHKENFFAGNNLPGCLSIGEKLEEAGLLDTAVQVFDEFAGSIYNMINAEAADK